MALREIGHVSDDTGTSVLVSVGRSQHGYEDVKVLLDVRGQGHRGIDLDLDVDQAEYLVMLLHEALAEIKIAYAPRRVGGYRRRR